MTPGKILTGLAMSLALGGDCLADVAVLRAQPQLSGPVASGPVISRLISALAADAPRALRAIRRARAAARGRAWALAGERAPGAGGSLVPVDIDATIVLAHPEKEKASPAWKKTFGFHPLAAFAGHGGGASGEPLAIVLRGGNAGSNTAAEHIEVTRLALPQLPRTLRRRVLIRTDSGGGTHDFLTWLASPGHRPHYPAGMTITEEMQEPIPALPDRIWQAACDAVRQARPGAWVAGLTGLLDLAGWPEGMRVIGRRERPHPGAQLRFTGINGHRFTAFATGARRGQLAGLGLRHRRRARCEDRIRNAKDTGLRNLPLHGFAQNQLWCELVAMASELLAWTAMPALDSPARAGEPKRLRLRLFSAAGRLARGGRRLRLRIAATWPWADQLTAAITRRQAFPPRLTSHNRPYDQKRQTPGPVEPRPPGATAGPSGTARR